jgi:hypothetical protein
MNTRTKVCAFNSGQFGDLIINVAGAKIFKDKCPDHLLYLNVAEKYKDIILLLRENKYVDGTQVWEGYTDWPTEYDKSIIESGKYDLIGYPMNPHKDNWHKLRHQTCEVGYQNDIVSLEECEKYKDGVQIELNQWFDVSRLKGYIAFFPFAGYYNPKNNKRLSVDKAQEIVDNIIKDGYKVLQIGGQDEPKLDGCEKRDTSIFESVRDMLGCDLLLHTDSFIGWAASGYQFRQIGLYNHSYYGLDCIKNIQPINSNAEYISVNDMDNINFEQIRELL